MVPPSAVSGGGRDGGRSDGAVGAHRCWGGSAARPSANHGGSQAVWGGLSPEREGIGNPAEWGFQISEDAGDRQGCDGWVQISRPCRSIRSDIRRVCGDAIRQAQRQGWCGDSFCFQDRAGGNALGGDGGGAGIPGPAALLDAGDPGAASSGMCASALRCSEPGLPDAPLALADGLLLATSPRCRAWTDPGLVVSRCEDSVFGIGPIQGSFNLSTESVLVSVGSRRVNARRAIDFGSEFQRSALKNSDAASASMLEPLVAGALGNTQVLRAASVVAVTGNRFPPSIGGSGDLASAQYNLDVSKPPDRSIPPSPSRRALVWIRRDLFISRRFAAKDCYPARLSEKGPVPRFFSFKRDWWSWRPGGREICAQILAMAPGGRGGGRKPSSRVEGAGGRQGSSANPAPSAGGPVQALPSGLQGEPQRAQAQAIGGAGTQQFGPGQGVYGGFPNLWGNPQLNQMGMWPQAYPMQFLPPQMMQGMALPNMQLQFPQVGQFPQQNVMPVMEGQGVLSQQIEVAEQKTSQEKGTVAGNSQGSSTHGAADKPSGKQVFKKPVISRDGLTFDQKYKGMICYNCGEPGHFVGMCQKQRRCFMCGNLGHHMDKCAEWYRAMPMAQFYGSAGSGLGFFHIEVEKPIASSWLNLENVGIAVVDGEISMEELKQNFSEMWKTNWPWQMRQLEMNKFLVRFPPGKKIKELVGYPSINLKKTGVSVSFMLWDGDVPVFSELQRVWISITGIPPRYLSWKVIARIATALGIPEDVDWHEIFRSFFSTVMIRVAVRDVTKIPATRVMEFEKKMYLLKIEIVDDPVEEVQQGNDDDPGAGQEGNRIGMDKDGSDARDGDRGMDTDLSQGSAENIQNGNGAPTPMGTQVAGSTLLNDVVTVPGFGDTPHVSSANVPDAVLLTPAPDMVVHPMSNEDRVRSKILGTPGAYQKQAGDGKGKAPADNICVELFRQFDSDSDEEDEEQMALDAATVEKIGNNNAAVMGMVGDKTDKLKQTWGPVVATRASARLKDTGKTMMEKALELKKSKNLEIPKGKTHNFPNSFAVLSNHILADRARGAGLCLGNNSVECDLNVAAIKHIETDRLVSFRSDNPDMFLPPNREICGGDLATTSTSVIVELPSFDPVSGMIDVDGSPWVEVASKKKGF